MKLITNKDEWEQEGNLWGRAFWLSIAFSNVSTLGSMLMFYMFKNKFKSVKCERRKNPKTESRMKWMNSTAFLKN